MKKKAPERRRQLAPRPTPFRVETTFAPDLAQYIQKRVAAYKEDDPQGVIRRAVRTLMQTEP